MYQLSSMTNSRIFLHNQEIRTFMLTLEYQWWEEVFLSQELSLIAKQSTRGFISSGKFSLPLVTNIWETRLGTDIFLDRSIDPYPHHNEERT